MRHDRSDRDEPGGPRIRGLVTEDLDAGEVAAIRALLWAAFADDGEGFTEGDWDHATGGLHLVLEVAGRILSHVSVVEREIHVGGRPLRAGYVEAVATAPDAQGRGHGTRVMTAAADHVRAAYELGVLGTGRHAFYERLGWIRWRGPSSVRTDAGERPTPEDDGYLLVLATPASPALDPDDPISCDWRPGDVW